MKIELKQIELRHFKGASEQTLKFGTHTEIRGANATGKTRIFDGFTFCLFGKDSEDHKDFNIKTLDSNNNPLHRVDSSAVVIIAVDGMDFKFERILREKWVKKRGEEDQEFAGHETSYFINGVPHKLSEYQAKVSSFLPEDIFKLVTNPMYFNALNWKDRRDLLFRIAGEMSDNDVVKSNAELKEFMDILAGKSLKEFRIEIAYKKKKLNETLSQIQPRTDEVARAILPQPDYAVVQKDIDKHNARIFQIDAQMASDAEAFNVANQENQRKHGVSFETAQYALADHDRVIAEDLAHSTGEKRYFCFGRVGGGILTVRFTLREDAIRILGAGYWRKGRRIYEEQNSLQ